MVQLKNASSIDEEPGHGWAGIGGQPVRCSAGCAGRYTTICTARPRGSGSSHTTTRRSSSMWPRCSPSCPRFRRRHGSPLAPCVRSSSSSLSCRPRLRDCCQRRTPSSSSQPRVATALPTRSPASSRPVTRSRKTRRGGPGATSPCPERGPRSRFRGRPLAALPGPCTLGGGTTGGGGRAGRAHGGPGLTHDTAPVSSFLEKRAQSQVALRPPQNLLGRPQREV